MKCDVLLIDTMSSFRVETGLVYPSLVTAQMTGFLDRENISFDVLFAIPQEDRTIHILHDNEIAADAFPDRLAALSPKIVAFFPEPELLPPCLLVHRQARKVLPGAQFCIGVNSGKAKRQYYHNAGFDYVCGQDLFTSFPHLVNELLRGRHPGSSFVAKDTTHADLSSFPFVSKKFFAHMKPQWCFPSGRIIPFGLVVDSLGCTGACPHCPNSSFWGSEWRAMSADRIFREIKYQKDLLDVDTFLFGGINVLPNQCGGMASSYPHEEAVNRLHLLDGLLRENSLEISFFGTIRPDTVSHLSQHAPEMLDCYLDRLKVCFMGLESFSATVLNGLGKNITLNSIRTAVSMLESRGIMIIASFMVGSPCETRETLAETEHFIMHELPRSSIPILNIMTPYPGSAFYDEMIKKSFLTKSDPAFFNGKHLVYRHPVFKPGELEKRIQEFYYRFFTDRYSV